MVTKLNVHAWIRILSLLYSSRDEFISSISRKLSMTYSHANAVVRLLEKEGYVETKKVGRMVLVLKTDMELAKYCYFIVKKSAGNKKRGN